MKRQFPGRDSHLLASYALEAFQYLVVSRNIARVVIIREDQQDIQPGRILIYRFDQSRVYYFEFLKDRLSRIYAVSCLQDNPDCE